MLTRVDDRSRFRKTKNRAGRECLVASFHRRFSSLGVEKTISGEGQPADDRHPEGLRRADNFEEADDFIKGDMLLCRSNGKTYTDNFEEADDFIKGDMLLCRSNGRLTQTTSFMQNAISQVLSCISNGEILVDIAEE